MSASRAPRAKRLTVAVVGAGGPLGAALAQRLAEPGMSTYRVLGIDAHRRPMPGVVWRPVDPADAALVGALSDVDVVVHAAIDPSLESDHAVRDERAAQLTANVLAACDAAGVMRLVLVSSAMVYGAVPDNAVPLPDDGPLLADGSVGLVRDLLEAEEQVAAWQPTTDVAVTVLRPALVTGETIDTALTRHFEAPLLLVLKDSTPLWQFTHVDDLASAIQCVVTHGVDGIVPVGCSGWLSQEEVEAVCGLRRLELPASAVISTADRLHRLGVSPAPAAELDYIRYPWVVSTARLAAHGWVPTWTNAQVLEALMVQARGRTAIASRRLGRPEATSLTAASAAAAVLGAAALVRARRRRLGG